MTLPTLASDRLILRAYRTEDRPAFAALNADPEGMRYFPAPLTRAESDALIERIHDHGARHGFGFWALERRADGAFIGMAGLAVPRFTAPFTPCVEIGWRLARAFWGHGYATEAAQASLDFAFGPLALDQVVAFTVPANQRSQAVMARLGMRRDPADDFEHPEVADGHPLRPHVLYRIDRADWPAGSAAA